MQEFVLESMHLLGPLAVFGLLMLSGVGVPLGEDIILIPAGTLIAKDLMNGPLTWLMAYTGVLGADLVWFTVCSRYGTPLLHKRWFKRAAHPRRLLEAKHQIEKRGVWVIVMARFIPGSRTPAITMAGLLHMRFLHFFLAEACCVAATVSIQLGIGYLIGRNIGTESTGELILTLLGVAVFVMAVLFGLNWWRQRRQSDERPPRAKMAWLRRFRRGRRRPTEDEAAGDEGSGPADATKSTGPSAAAAEAPSVRKETQHTGAA